MHIADTPAEFVAAAERAMAEDPTHRRAQADAFLVGNSWDSTFAAMADLVMGAVRKRARAGQEPALVRTSPRRIATRSAVR